ncbi:MAG: hypothetical protein HKP21_02925 [Xanthomonadales bacterium]|nr:hypothetical protein [Gammaproteobacteria bacterium]MBT8072640.1 hypothetical protein [Gammaproteobacteria bacterium]MBT8075523.1 hypothetical protein [Gammaproteobacteria bacterium]NNK03481.1 hypothetical protein [Xanthomonadales bacterium]NNK99318.1 hypothetical protein [Xanthomonadales bacterium]
MTKSTDSHDQPIGSYDIRPWGGEDMVFCWKGGLAMVNLPTMNLLSNLVRLKHVDADIFRTIRSDDQVGHEVSFRRNASGEVTHILYHGVE